MAEEKRPEFQTVGKRTFQKVYRITDKNNGYKTVYEGITTKWEARKRYNETNHYYILPEWIEI